MTDTLGALTLPVDPAQTPVGDPLRMMLGQFLQAAIIADCQAAWGALCGNSSVCERVEINDPNDNTFVTNKLPCLAIMREGRSRKPVQNADEIRYRESQVSALWIPPVAVQRDRAAREGFLQAVEAAADKAVENGRTPGWVVAGDTDPLAQQLGSYIGTQLGLLRPLSYGVEFSDVNVGIEIPQQPTKNYPALKITFQLWEKWEFDTRGVHETQAMEATIVTNLDDLTEQEFVYPDV